MVGSAHMKQFVLHADEEAQQLIRRGAEAAAQLAASTGTEDEAQKGAFHTLKLVRQLLIADQRCRVGRSVTIFLIPLNI